MYVVASNGHRENTIAQQSCIFNSKLDI